jgi:hypothetical protein
LRQRRTAKQKGLKHQDQHAFFERLVFENFLFHGVGRSAAAEIDAVR